jgi:hypothetical protein
MSDTHFTTFDGGTIDVTRIGAWVDMHLRAPDGRTVATVQMSADDAEGLVRELGGHTEDELEESYQDGEAA